MDLDTLKKEWLKLGVAEKEPVYCLLAEGITRNRTALAKASLSGALQGAGVAALMQQAVQEAAASGAETDPAVLEEALAAAKQMHAIETHTRYVVMTGFAVAQMYLFGRSEITEAGGDWESLPSEVRHLVTHRLLVEYEDSQAEMSFQRLTQSLRNQAVNRFFAVAPATAEVLGPLLTGQDLAVGSRFNEKPMLIAYEILASTDAEVDEDVEVEQTPPSTEARP